MQLQTNLQIHSEGPLGGQVSTEVSTKREVITVASASESERLEALVSLVKSSLNAGYIIMFVFFFPYYTHLIRKLQGQV